MSSCRRFLCRVIFWSLCKPTSSLQDTKATMTQFLMVQHHWNASGVSSKRHQQLRKLHHCVTHEARDGVLSRL